MTSTAFVLKSVELKNWKTFAEATLSIEEQGLTGIVGRNGAGKSSFVDAILWCLFGKQPDGVTKGSLRRRNSDPKKDETFVRVTFTHAGQTIEAYREMKGKNHTVTGGLFLDGKEVVVATGSTVEAWVVNRLGMDAQGFRTAVIVPQKELDSLVDATAAKRREHIEKLAGVEDMNLAVKKAREQENELSKQIKVLPGSQEQVDEAGEFFESMTHAFEDISHRLAESSMEESEAKTALDSSIEEGREHKEQLQKAVSVSNQATKVEHEIEMLDSRISSISAQIESVDAETSDVDVNARPELEQEYRTLTSSINDLNKEASESEARISSSRSELSRAEKLLQKSVDSIAESESSISEYEETLAGLPSKDETEAKKSEAENEVSTARGRISSLESLVSELNESIGLLEASHGHEGAECPTCHTALSEPASLIAQFKENVTSSKSEIVSLKKTVSENQSKISELNSILSESEKLASNLEYAKRDLASAKESEAEARDALSKAKAQFEEASSIDIDSLRNEAQKLDSKRKEVLSKGEAIAAAEKMLTRRKELAETLEQAQEARKPLSGELARLNEELDAYGDLGLLEGLVSSFEDKVRKLRNAHTEAFTAMKDLESAKASASERMNSAEAALHREEQLAEKKTEALAVLEHRAAVSDLLDEYRKERIARIAPELSITSTDLISQMTSGKFIEVIVADDFSTSVVKADGTEYAVAELSGGEKSVVALALRIAIGSLITGENAGLLWLDEVLPAQDTERRDAILNVLRSLPIQQIVMINHTHEAEDVVDRIVKVVAGDDGSTIE